MFEYDMAQRSHFTGKDGITTYEYWCKKMGIDTGEFPFNVKTLGRTQHGLPISFKVVSWGFYQGSDYRYYVFIAYRSGDQKTTTSYHWDTDSDGMPIGAPRKHHWSN